MGVRREPPLTFAALEPIVRRSRVAGWFDRSLDALARAIAGAGVVAMVQRLTAQLRSDSRASVIARGAWVVAAAGMTHIAMLLFVEQYHYPSRAALVMPAVIVVVALVAMRMSETIASALADRSQR